MDLQLALLSATEAAHAAGDCMIEAFHADRDFTLKSDVADPVTQCDIDCENIIISTLQKSFPAIPFLSEEKTHTQNEDAETRWVIDPIDGTMNFAHKLPFFGASIALQQGGESVVGVLHFPLLQWTYTVIKGQGAFKNGEQIHVRDCASLETAIISEMFTDRETRGKKVLFPPVAAYRKFGSAITSLALVAEGALDGTVLHCYEWDVAAGGLLVEEAGGVLTKKYSDEQDPRSAISIVASAPKIHEELMRL